MLYEEGKLREEDSGDNGEELQTPVEDVEYGTESSEENLDAVLPNDVESDVLEGAKSEGQRELAVQALAAVEELQDETEASVEILTQEMGPDNRGIFEKVKDSIASATKNFLAVGLLSLGSLGIGAQEVNAQQFDQTGRLIKTPSQERSKRYDTRTQAIERNVELTIKQLKIAIPIIDSRLTFLTLQEGLEEQKINSKIEANPNERKTWEVRLGIFKKNIERQRDALQNQRLLLTTTLAGYEKGLDDISDESKPGSPKTVDGKKTKPAPPRIYKQKTKSKGGGMPKGTGK